MPMIKFAVQILAVLFLLTSCETGRAEGGDVLDVSFRVDGDHLTVEVRNTTNQAIMIDDTLHCFDSKPPWEVSVSARDAQGRILSKTERQPGEFWSADRYSSYSYTFPTSLFKLSGGESCEKSWPISYFFRSFFSVDQNRKITTNTVEVRFRIPVFFDGDPPYGALFESDWIPYKFEDSGQTVDSQSD